MRDIRRSQADEEDPDVLAYLQSLGRRLVDASKSGQEFEFFLVRDASLNAFALPGGFIGVHSGLIAAAESESELAGVLAHEIGHVTQRHIARMLGKSRDAGIAQMVGLVLAALAARSNPQATPGLIALGQQMAQDQMLSFSRDAEREADRIGFDTLTRAGFDPQGMVSFFGRIQRASRVYESAAPAYLRTHPLTTERMSDMQARIREERYRQWPDALGFRLIRARMQALIDPSVDGLRRQAERFESQIKEQSTLDRAAAWFGLASVRQAQLRWAEAYDAAQVAAELLQQEGVDKDSAASALERVQIQALAGQGLHLNPGAPFAAHKGFAADRIVLNPVPFDADLAQAQGMTKRDQFGGALCRHDACNPGYRQHIAFAGLTGLHLLTCAGQHADAARRGCLSACDRLVSDINHHGSTRGIKVAKSLRGELFVHATIIAR
ncbi:MAG: hypothetical protein EBW05_10940 [Betaproteobacteria bacterium]|nr:hypothetical protein [Betaproteobacteria bacterium]